MNNFLPEIQISTTKATAAAADMVIARKCKGRLYKVGSFERIRKCDCQSMMMKY